MITLSTVATAAKGKYADPPPSSSFPIPYTETFDNPIFSEASNFADQSGKFETFYNQSSTDGHKWTLRQVCWDKMTTCLLRTKDFIETLIF